MCESDRWCKARAKQAVYQRREPTKTVLYRIVSSCREELPRVWEERFQSEYTVLRDAVLETLDQYLNCAKRTLSLALLCGYGRSVSNLCNSPQLG
jgi:hypothetical protein